MDQQTIYTPGVIGGLEFGWGQGWLSPGGREDIAALVADVDLLGKSLLDIGVGAGGPARVLVKDFGVERVTGIDVEQSVLDRARELNVAENLEGRIELLHVKPRRLPFSDDLFDVVFSKDSFVHIAHKATLFSEIYRVLKPGGRCLFSDWCCGWPPYSEEMRGFLKNGMNFSMATLEENRRHLIETGFTGVSVMDRHAWFVDYAANEAEAVSGPRRAGFIDAVGRDAADRLTAAAQRRATIARQGHLRPAHFQASKPGLRG